MDILFNELSIHQQFPDVAAFCIAIDRVMAVRELARRQYGRKLQIHYSVANANVMPGMLMQQAVQGWGKDKQRSLMQWLAQSVPFGEEFRRNHEGD